MKRGVPLFLAILFTGLPCLSEDLVYVQDNELLEEMQSRKNDIQRTADRIEKLKKREAASQDELKRANENLQRIEQSAVVRAKLLYRISRHGGSLGYLLSASSAVDFLKRLSKLKFLLVKGLEARREMGLRLAQAEKKHETILQEEREAEKLLEMLSKALSELEAERTARKSTARVGFLVK